MFRVFVYAVAAGLVCLGALYLLTRASPAAVARFIRVGGGLALGVLAGLFLITGRIMLAGLAAAGAGALFGWRIPIPGLPGGGPFGGNGRSGPRDGQSSSVETEWLSMVLDHDSGRMEGTVRAGRRAGRTLTDLDLPDLLDLRGEISGDAQSLALLDAYLDRRFGPEWRDDAGDADAGSGPRPEGSTGAMSRADALAVLGLQEGASAAEIKAAHRRLMQAAHPDRGGSAWLAARINAARDFLLTNH